MRFSNVSAPTDQTEADLLHKPNDPETGDSPEDGEEALKQLLDSSQQVLFLTSFDRRSVHYVSPSYEEVWGRSRESLYREPLSWMDSIHPEDRERTRLAHEKESGTGSELNYRITEPSGATRWISARGWHIKDAVGSGVRLCEIATDVTSLKLAAETYRVAADKYDRIVDSAREGIWVIDSREITTFVNDQMATMLGYAVPEMLGRSMFDFISWEAQGVASANVARKRGVQEQRDYMLRKKDGGAIWVLMSSSPLRDKEGRYEGSLTMVTNVTRRHRAEEAMLRLASIVESSEDCIVGASMDGIIRYCNPSTERIFRYTCKEIFGRDVSVLCPALLEAGSQIIARVKSGENIYQHQSGCVGKDGRKFDASLSFTQTKDATGRSIGFSAVIRDVSQAKQLATMLRQSEKMADVGLLAGGIAHDFNNALTAISGYSQFLLESLASDDPRRDDVLEIANAGDRAAALTRQLLAFSRQQTLTLTVLDLNAVIANLEKMLQRVLRENVELTFLPGADLGRVRADSGQIEQIIMNLTVNARDAMPEGGKLTVTTSNVDLGEPHAESHPGSKPGPHVLITVSDTGCGMTEDVFSHLFEPFFTTKEHGKGTGLGLATLYAIVQQCGGSIDVVSELTHGTEFKIYLPRVDEDLTPAKPAPAAPVSDQGTETVLLVEDDALVRKFASRVLHENGYSVWPAAAPMEALRLCELRRNRIHVLLTDVVMPQMSGYELAKRILTMRPEIQVIFMSGYTDKSISAQAASLNAKFLQKPLAARAIVQAVREALDGPPKTSSTPADPGPMSASGSI